MLFPFFTREIVFESAVFVTSRWSVLHFPVCQSVLLQDVARVWKRLQAVSSITLSNVSMFSIGFTDTAAFRQSKQACTAFEFCSVSPSLCTETCSKQESKS